MPSGLVLLIEPGHGLGTFYQEEINQPVLLSKSSSFHSSTLSVLQIASLSPRAYIPHSFVLLPRKLIKRPSTFSLYFCLAFSYSLSVPVQSTANCTVQPVALCTLFNNLHGPWCHGWSRGQLRVDPGADLLVAPGACVAGGCRVVKSSCFPLFGELFSHNGCLLILFSFYSVYSRADQNWCKAFLSYRPSVMMQL